MKNYLNKEQIEQLKPYESHFETVINAKYKRATISKINDIVANIYEETTNEIVDRNWSCAKCVFNLFEKCGKLYYSSLKHFEELEKIQLEQNEQKQDKPKRGRKQSSAKAKSTK